MPTSFFSEWNLGFFLGIVKVEVSADQLVIVRVWETIPANAGCNNSMVEAARPVRACIENSPPASEALSLTTNLSSAAPPLFCLKKDKESSLTYSRSLRDSN